MNPNLKAAMRALVAKHLPGDIVDALADELDRVIGGNYVDNHGLLDCASWLRETERENGLRGTE